MNFNGRPVCGYNWDLIDAGVACRSLSENGIALEATREGGGGWRQRPSTGWTMIGDVQCHGNETSLLQCEHETEHDCGGEEAAGVVCTGNTGL